MRRQARDKSARCELAEPGTECKCKCRCGGRLHGAARVDDSDGLAYLSWFDPHYPGGYPELPLWREQPEVRA